MLLVVVAVIVVRCWKMWRMIEATRLVFGAVAEL